MHRQGAALTGSGIGAGVVKNAAMVKHAFAGREIDDHCVLLVLGGDDGFELNIMAACRIVLREVQVAVAG